MGFLMYSLSSLVGGFVVGSVMVFRVALMFVSFLCRRCWDMWLYIPLVKIPFLVSVGVSHISIALPSGICSIIFCTTSV